MHAILATTIAVLGWGWALVVVHRRVAGSRPGLRVLKAVEAGFAIRIVGAAVVSLTGIGQSLRGGDELVFLADAQRATSAGLLSPDSVHLLTHQLHTWTFAAQDAILGGAPNLELRVTQAGFASLAILLLAAAVHDLAGQQAARIAAWLLVFEPTNVFFSTLLHKEALMLLAAAAVVYGAAIIWRSGSLRGLAPMTAGCLIGVATRPYAGYFLIGAAAVTTLHASLRPQTRQSLRSNAMLALVILLGAVSAPTVWHASSPTELQTLQRSQNANASGPSNLKLELVDYSTAGKVITNLPRRLADLVTKPYPWQVANISQQLGAIGTMVEYVVIIALASVAISRRRLFRRAAPLGYATLFLLVTYALSAGNAGTAFRYRTHVIAMALCLLVVIREHGAWPRQRSDVPASLAPVSTTSSSSRQR